MLELIVLGKIPGTNIQVTLAWFVLVFFGLIIYFDLKFHNHNFASAGKQKHNKSTKKPSLRA